ncbi:MAG: flagellar hook-basal body complex protein [Deltaproteobacteria bacterium]|nr:flagellar hook-basal body complex protein [Deltaproteobacteria bacterium]
MLRSFYSGISGLRNHQQSMDVIGNNIANVNTPGFKASRVTFMDTLSQTLQGVQQASATLGGRDPIQVGSGMTVAAIDKDMGQGSAQSTGRSMDLAIQGNGFFVVGSGANHYYTRAGATSVDNENNLVTNTGDKLWGWVDTNQDGSIDPTLDQQQWISLDRRGDGRVTNALASATPTVSGANLGDTSLSAINVLPTTVTDDWTVTCTDAQTGTFTVSRTKSSVVDTVVVGNSFTDPNLGTFSINGGVPNQAALLLGDVDVTGALTAGITVTALDWGAGGNYLSVQLTSSATPNQTISVTMQGTEIVVHLATDASGKPKSTLDEIVTALTAPTSPSSRYVTAVATGAKVLTDTTQAYLTGGSGPNEGDSFTFSTTAPGGSSVQTISVSKDGTVVGVFDNGTTEELARLGVATITNPEGLFSIGDGKFAESPTSGNGFPPVTAGTAGTGTISAGFLEMSNVDLTREFTDMITTQRGFQANSKIITTSDEMLQDLLALKR